MSGARTTVVAAAGISLAVAIGVTGCGAAKQLTAKQQVSNALSGFSKASSAAFTLKLDTTVADAAAISKAEGSPMSASDQSDLAKVISGDVVVNIVAPAGKTFGDTEKVQSGATSQDLTSLLNDPAAMEAALKKEGSFSTAINADGSTLFDLRSLDGVIYAKADVKRILSLSGEDPASLNQALASLPPSMSSLGAAIKGQWVSIDLAKAAAAAKSQGLLKSLPTPAPTASVDPAKVQKLITDLETAYQQKATITRLGSSDKGNGYRLGAPAQQVAQAVSGDLVTLAGKQYAGDIRKSIAQIPNKTFSLDLWVKDDKLTDVSLDLTQFLTKPVTGKKLALDIAVNVGGGSVSAPSGATEIDIKSMLGELTSGLSGLGGTSGSASGSGTAVPTHKLTKAEIKSLKQSGLTNAQIKQYEDALSGKGA